MDNLIGEIGRLHNIIASSEARNDELEKLLCEYKDAEHRAVKENGELKRAYQQLKKELNA